MDSIFEAIREIRDIINSPLSKPELLKDKKNWNKLCSSLDNIEDSQHAINRYQDLKGFQGYEGYLLLYGLIHAFYLQQDAINSLSRSLIDKKINYKKEYPKLYRIREIRNDSIGHPTNRKHGEYHVVINQNTINKTGFEYLIYNDDAKTKFEYVNLTKVINTQEELSIEILNKIYSFLKKDIEEHKSNFSGNKLSDLITSNNGYFFQKLYERCYSTRKPKDFTKANILYLKNDVFEKIMEGIKERYKTIDAIAGLEHQAEKIRYIFEELLKLLDKNKYSQGYDAEILIDSLEHEFDELNELIKDIDREFELE